MPKLPSARSKAVGKKDAAPVATATFGTQVEDGDVAMEGDDDDELQPEDSFLRRERRISHAALNLLDVSQEDYAEFTPRWSNDGNDWLVEDGVHQLQPDDIGKRWTSATSGWETTAESGVLGHYETAPRDRPRKVKRAHAPPSWGSRMNAGYGYGRPPLAPAADAPVATTSEPDSAIACDSSRHRVNRLSADTAAGLLKMPTLLTARPPLEPLKSPLSPLSQVVRRELQHLMRQSSRPPGAINRVDRAFKLDRTLLPQPSPRDAFLETKFETPRELSIRLKQMAELQPRPPGVRHSGSPRLTRIFRAEPEPPKQPPSQLAKLQPNAPRFHTEGGSQRQDAQPAKPFSRKPSGRVRQENLYVQMENDAHVLESMLNVIDHKRATAQHSQPSRKLSPRKPHAPPRPTAAASQSHSIAAAVVAQRTERMRSGRKPTWSVSQPSLERPPLIKHSLPALDLRGALGKASVTPSPRDAYAYSTRSWHGGTSAVTIDQLSQQREHRANLNRPTAALLDARRPKLGMLTVLRSSPIPCLPPPVPVCMSRPTHL